jgi:hypothetical protein
MTNLPIDYRSDCRIMFDHILYDYDCYFTGVSGEHTLLQRALNRSRAILDYVNQSVKDRENEHKLADFQRRLDRRDPYQVRKVLILKYFLPTFLTLTKLYIVIPPEDVAFMLRNIKFCITCI